jgi:hypothetical protein
MQIPLSHESGRRALPSAVTNRQRLARYDLLIERAQQRAEAARGLATRRRYLQLMLRLQQRALREVNRGR